mgnify:CR=1 FL=1
MSRKHRQQHEAKRAQLDHYHALDTEPAEGWDGIDADYDEAGELIARGMAAWPAAQQGQQAQGAKG